MENLTYAIVQSLHNLGAVGVVAAPVMALYLLRVKESSELNSIIYVALVSAVLQLISGIGFAFTSQYFLGQIPQVEGIAFNALAIKVTGVVLSIIIYLVMLFIKKLDISHSRSVWRALLVLGFVPLFGAAFLRWYG